MTKYENKGQIIVKEHKLHFHWIFPISWLLTKEEDTFFTSPHFRLLNSCWYLTLYPNVQFESKGWTGLFLCRSNIGSPIKITYILGIDVNNLCISFRKTHIFDRRCDSSGKAKFVEQRRIKPLFNLPVFQDPVEIMCKINEYAFVSQQVIPNSVSCAIQTEIPDSVSCAIQTEIPDRVSCAIQTEIPDIVSYDIQTEILDSVSCEIDTEITDSVCCAIPTEVPYSGIDKENCKDEDVSSLDTKEDAILKDLMPELMSTDSVYDVTICVQDKEFQAHRNILSAFSPVFTVMLTHDTKENNKGTINIQDCDPDTFDEFLKYMYSGRTRNLTASKALQLYYTANKYCFTILQKHCVSLLETSLSITSICDVALLAIKYQEKELLELASEFFARNFHEILVSDGWQSFMIHNPLEASELYTKGMNILFPKR